MVKALLKYFIYVLAAKIVFIILFLNLAPQFGSNPTSSQMNYYEAFDNYADGSFRCVEQTPMMTGKISTWDFFVNHKSRRPNKIIIPKNIDYSQFREIESEKYKIAWLGHSSFIINIKGKIILLDPMLGTHAAPIPIPNLRRYSNLALELDSILKIDMVIISHDHYDHLDHFTINKIKDDVKLFIVPHGVGNHLKKWKIPGNKITEMNWGESYEEDEIVVRCLESRHFSGRGPFNRNSTLWSSWAIKSPSVNIYFSGDSGYGKHLKKIGERYGPFDISLIDCGQYNQAWKYSHMFPHQAVLGAIDLRTQYFMPIHWGGFTLAMHPWDEPVLKSIETASSLGLKYFTPEIGEIVTDKTIANSLISWWENY